MDSNGNVVAAGAIVNTDTAQDSIVVKLAGTDGAEVWRRTLNGTADADESANAVAVDGNGDVVAVGRITNRHGNEDFFVLKLSGADGADLTPLAGEHLEVLDDLSERRLLVLSKDPALTPPWPGSLADPTLGGALLELLNPTTGEVAAMALPADGWIGLGVPAGSKGYEYTDPAQVAGPCKLVTLNETALRASCAGGQLAFSLDEPTQGSLGIRLTTGTGSGANRYCLLFGGTVVKDTPATAGRRGVFRAGNAAAAVCPSVP